MQNCLAVLKICYCVAAALIGAAVGATAPASWRASADVSVLSTVSGSMRGDQGSRDVNAAR
jgi:hypothetical protein